MNNKFILKNIRSKKGIVTLFLALMLIPLLGVGALVMDLSQQYAFNARVKTAVDLGALAGVSQLVSLSNVDDAKNTTVEYLNYNLTSTLPSFEPLDLNSTDLSVQVGVYDLSEMTFTWDEVNSGVNAIMVSYTYDAMTYIAPIFMVNSLQVTSTTTVAKQVSGSAAQGTSFPIVVSSSVLSAAASNSNMVTLYQSGMDENSYFTAFDSNANSSDIIAIVNNFEHSDQGMVSPELSVSNSFVTSNSDVTNIYSNLGSYFLNKTFIVPVVTIGMDSMVTTEGFVGFTVTNIDSTSSDPSISGEIVPGYIDNSSNGLKMGSGVGNIDSSLWPLLAYSFGLVQ